jgi:hypothetical protein
MGFEEETEPVFSYSQAMVRREADEFGLTLFELLVY